MRTFADQHFGRAKYHMGIALAADPSLDLAREPAAIAARNLAEARYRGAHRMEDDGFCEPALREYEALAEDYPALPGLADRIVSTRREVEAQRLAESGELAVFRGEFTRARGLLEQAYDMSESQRDSISEKLDLVRERELEHRYLLAKDLELQQHYEQALAEYRAIDKEDPGFEDVLARTSQLEASIEEAGKFYEAGLEAEKNGEIEAAIEGFVDALLFYPGYKDAAERLAKLRS